MPCQTFDLTAMKAPANGYESLKTIQTFPWNKLTGATLRLQVNDASDFSGTMLVDTTNTLLPTSASFKNTTPFAPGTYYWRLSADGGMSWMPAWKFIVH
jgi:hypothetical protein